MSNIFTKHPQSMGETYGQHFICATKFGTKMIVGGFFCFIHALFPFLFQKTGSNFLFQMVNDYVDRAPVVEDRMITLSRTVEKKSTP